MKTNNSKTSKCRKQTPLFLVRMETWLLEALLLCVCLEAINVIIRSTRTQAALWQQFNALGAFKPPFAHSWDPWWSKEAVVPEGQPSVFPSSISYLQTVGSANRQYKQENRSHFSDFKLQKYGKDSTKKQARWQKSVPHTSDKSIWSCYWSDFFSEITFYFMPLNGKKDLDLTIKFMQRDPWGNTSIENTTKVQRH